MEVGLGANVKRLTRDLVGQHYCLYMDNFFSSVSLFESLLKGIYATGTLLVTATKKGLPMRGDYVYAQDGNLAVTVWQDTKPVVIISTQHRPTDKTTVQRKKLNLQYGAWATSKKLPCLHKAYYTTTGVLAVPIRAGTTSQQVAC